MQTSPALPASRPDVGVLLAAPFSCPWTLAGSGCAWVSPTGELDHGTSARFARALRQAQFYASLVAVDLRQLDFMDSAGAHAIVAAHERAERTAGRLVVIRGPRRIDNVFTLTGAGADLEIVDLGPGEAPHTGPAQALALLPFPTQ